MSKLDVVICFDYDLTLTDEYQQMPLITEKFSLFQQKYPEMKVPMDFFAISNKLQPHSEPRIGYMHQMCTDAMIIGPFAQKQLREAGKKVKLAKGIPAFFPEFKRFTEERQVNIHYHAISMGLYDMMMDSPVAPHMESIRASHFEYASDGSLLRPTVTMGPFDKIGAIIEIIKGGENSRDKLVHPSAFKFDYRNLICIGDGFSDVPKFAYVRERGGFPILVYGDGDYDKIITDPKKAEILERVLAIVPRDYSVDGPIWRMINHFIGIMKQRTCADEWDPRHFHVYRKNQLLLRRGQKAIIPFKLKECIEEHIKECGYCRMVATDQLLVIPPGEKDFFATTPEKIVKKV